MFIPTYCYHPALTVVASCRMCLIEMGDLKDGKVTMIPKVFPGCQTPVKDGTVIVTGDYDKRDTSIPALPYDPKYVPGDRAKKSQADTLEGLLLNHPLDCPVCDKAGECKLQDYSFEFGRSETRLIDEKNQPANKPGISSKITLVHRSLHHVHPLRALYTGNRGHGGVDGHEPRPSFGDRHFSRRAAREQACRQRRRSLSRRGAGRQGFSLQAARLVLEIDRQRLQSMFDRLFDSYRFEQGHRVPPAATRKPSGTRVLHVRRGAVWLSPCRRCRPH